MQEIYKDLSSPKNKEFEKLLNTEFSKSQISEGKIVDGTITKITNKLIFVNLPGGKSEGTLDINEIKLLKEEDSLKINSTISVLVVKLEDKNGNLVISRDRAKKLKSWTRLEKAFKNNEEVTGMIASKIKGGFICEISSTLCFLPGSQISTSPMKNIASLMKEPQKFMIVKVDKVRGNIVVSRRAILEKMKNATQDEMFKKFKVGDVVEGVVKNLVEYGAFLDVDGYDVLLHLNEISYSRISHPADLLETSQRVLVKIIKIDEETKRVSVSLKSLAPDPFETKINNYKVGDICSAKVIRLTDYGAFVSLEEGLEGLCHQTELSFSNRNISAKKLFSISQTINVKIMEIDKMKRRISLSYRATQINPWEKFAKEFKVGSKVDGIINNKNEFSLFVNIKDYDLTGVVNYKDLSWSESGEEQLKKFKINDPITTRVLEFDKDKQKCRLGVKQCQPDPMDYFKDKKKKDIITVVILKILDNGIEVKPDGCPMMKILIKKNQIAVDKQDQRSNRYNKNDRVDCMIQSIDLKNGKVFLSIKMLEEEQNKRLINKWGSVDSGRSLPFAELPKSLKKKTDKKKEEK